MRWFIRVSHPIVNPLAAQSPHRLVPPYEEVLVEQQWGIRVRVGGAMGHPDVFHNPKEVICLMQGIQSEWSMLEQMSAPRRRSRSPRDGPI